MKHKIVKITLFVVILIAFLTDLNVKLWRNPKRVIESDVVLYYAYLPAYFIYDDVTLKFKEHYSGPHQFNFWGKKLSNGNYLTKMTMGLSFLYTPFFLAGHGLAKITDADDGGFSWPYRLALVFSALFYLGIGLFFLSKILLRYFSEIVVAISIVVTTLGTNLFYYSTFEPGMSHVYNFALFIVFLFFVIKWHEKKSFWYSLLVGLLLGLLTLVRPINILAVILFFFYGITSFPDLKHRFFTFLKAYKYLFVILISFFLVLIPQLIYWKTVTGHWIYYSYTDERFFFSSPQIIEGLFYFRKGWLLYTPVMIFAIWGLFYLRHFAKNVFLPIVLLFPIYLFVVFSWWTWWYGGSFGMRPLIDIYGLLAFGISAFVSMVINQKRLIKYVSLFFISLFTLQGVFFTMKYHYGSIHWDSMTKEAYFDTLFRLHSSPQFYSLLAPPNYKAARKGLNRGFTLKKAPYFKVSEKSNSLCNGFCFSTDFEAVDENTTQLKAYKGSFSYYQHKKYSPIITLQKSDLLGLSDKHIAYCFSAKFYSNSSLCNFSIVASSSDGKIVYKAHDFKKIKNEEWQQIYYTDTLDTIPSILKFYFWNHDTLSSFYIDDMQLSFRQLP